MIGTLYNRADTEVDLHCTAADEAVLEDRYATVPIAAARPVFCQQNEEELHTSFEEAISDRVLAMNRQLQRLSGSLNEARLVQPQTDGLQPDALIDYSQGTYYALTFRAWQWAVLAAALTLMLIMLGFDLMGLLILHYAR